MSKTVLVTGASRGIGRACALRLADDGFNVAVNYARSDEEAAKVVEEIKSKGVEAVAIKADVSVPDEVNEMFKTLTDTFGGIDVLVNNAGIVRDELLLTMNHENLARCMDLNVKGYFYCAQQAALKMFRKRSGVIINMSSVSSKKAIAGQAVYSATKGAVNSLTQTLAVELGSRGIRVNAIAPGFVNTEMIDALPEEKKAEYLKAVPLGRFAEASEIAELVAFLASDRSAYITGQTIVLDGGLSL